jgi:ubiquinone/menaquinone biosynthesis C-methylase UbiE
MEIQTRQLNFGWCQLGVGSLLLVVVVVLALNEGSIYAILALGFFGLMLVMMGAFIGIGLRLRKWKLTVGGHESEAVFATEYYRKAVDLEIDVEPKTIDTELRKVREEFAKTKHVPGGNAPDLNILEDRHHHKILPVADRMSPMYLLDESFRIVDWNLAFSLAFDRSMEGRRGLSVLEWSYLLDNYEDVLNHGESVFSEGKEPPNIDVETIRFTSARYGELEAVKRAYKIPNDDGDSILGWLTILDVSFASPSSKIKYQSELIRMLSTDDMWSEYSISYDRVLTNTNVYNQLLDTMVGDGTVFPEIPRGSRILDLGCGTGNLALKLAEQDKDFRIVAVDNNTCMLELLKGKCAHYLSQDPNQPGIIPVKQDITTLFGFQESLFDVVILNNVLYTLPDPAGCLWHVWRVLKPDGEIRISGPKKDTKLDVLFAQIQEDLEQRMVFDKVKTEFNHVKAINKLRLHPLLFKWTLEDVQRILTQAGFAPSKGSDKVYAGQAMIVGGQKQVKRLAKVS